MNLTLISEGPSEECGCPEQLWRIGTLEALIHLEADGSGHVILDAGDWDMEREVPAPTTLDALKAEAVAMVAALPVE